MVSPRKSREQQKRRGSLDFKHRDRRIAVGGFAIGERIGQRGIVDEFAATGPADAKALVEANQIGRGVDVHALSRRLQDRTHERDGRALAVGAGDVDHQRQLVFRVIERRQKPLDAAERQIDALGMQRQQSREDGVDSLRIGRRRAHAGAGKLARVSSAPAAGALVNSRHSLAMVPRRS